MAAANRRFSRAVKRAYAPAEGPPVVGGIPSGDMFVRRITALAVIGVGALFLAACQPTVDVSRAGNNVRAGLSLAPPDKPLLPLRRDGSPIKPSAVEGSKVFMKAQCVVCHGPEGLGNGPAAPHLKSPGQD